MKQKWLKAMLRVTLIALTASLPKMALADSSGIDGNTGELHVSGWLIEQPYGLRMRSDFQEVVMDNTAVASLNVPGSMGEPMAFELHLRDYLKQANQETYTQSHARPLGVTVTFTGPSDEQDPDLLSVSGSSGVGLLIRDAKGQHIKPGIASAPQYVEFSTNDLVYSVTAVRTSGPLIAGPFRAEVAFELNYE